MASQRTLFHSNPTQEVSFDAHRGTYGNHKDPHKCGLKFRLAKNKKWCSTTHRRVCWLSTYEIWQPQIGRSTLPFTCSFSAIGGPIFRFHCGIFGLLWSHCYSSGHGSLIKRNSLRDAPTPLYKSHYCASFHGNCLQDSWNASQSGLWSWFPIHQLFLARVVQTQWNQIMHELSLSPLNRRTDRGIESHCWTIS